MSQCKVVLENYSGIYYAGSEIRGRVECYFNSEKTVRGIKIRLKCKEHNEWTGSETYHDSTDNREKTRYVTFSGDNTVLAIEQYVQGTGHGTTELRSGRHVFPFELTLPQDIPSSFNGPHGAVLYEIKAIVDRPMRADYEDKFIFVVKSPIDFNRKPLELQEVTSFEDEKNVCCWCCAGGNITVNVELPKTAFVPGETIDFKAIVTNMSNTNVEKISVKFTKRIRYKVDSPKHDSKDDFETILEFAEHGVGAHGEHVYNLQLQIPEYIEVPNFHRCSLFESSYKLAFVTVFSNCSMDLDIDVWPEMGHIAYNQSGSWETIPEAAVAGAYPPPVPYPTQPGFYPPPAGPYPGPPAPYPPYPTAPGDYSAPVPGYPAPPPNYPPGDKPVYPPAMPTAPGDAKAMEAAGPGGPSAPSAPGSEMPPPSYFQAQQMNNAPYPPQ